MGQVFLSNDKKLKHILLCLHVYFLTISQSFGQVCGSAQIFTYNEFTGAFTIAGATTLVGGTHAGPLGAALGTGGPTVALPGTGDYLGVSDGFLSFVTPTGTVEIYNGFGVYAGVNIPTTLLPSKGTTASLNDEPHSGDQVRSNGTRNAAGNGTFIDIGDDDAVYLDSDGSLSSYYNLFLSGTCPNGGQGYLAYDPTWTTYSGGPLNGQAVSKANILGVEDLLIYTLGAAGDNNYHFYNFLTGAYGGISNFGFPTFTGGPLAGTTPRAAMTNTVPGITFLGGGGLDLVFYNGTKLIWYNRNNLFQTDGGLGATGLSDGNVLDAFDYNHTAIADVLGADFMGIGDAEVLLLDATGHMEWYSVFTTGVGVYEADFSTLRGPQGGKPVNNPSYIDATDNGYSFLDADGTISWYNNTTNTVYHDANWRTFTGGPLNGVAPSKSNIIATEDAGVYVVDTDGSLFYYSICDGKPYLGLDLNTQTVLTNGPLNGKDLSDAVTNMIPGVSFLGISNDEMIFAVCLKPEVEATKRVIAILPNPIDPVTCKSTHNVTYEVKLSNVGPVPIDNLQIKDSIAAQLGCSFVRIIPGSLLISQWGLTFPLTPLATVNPNFNGTTDINVLSTTNTTAGLPTNFLWNTVTVWYTAEIDADCNGTCGAPNAPTLLNQARGIGQRIGGTEKDSDLSDDGYWDSADYFPVAPQPPTALLFGQSLFYLENQPWPGNSLAAPFGTNKRDNPTPLIFPGVTTKKGIIGSMPDPTNPDYALAEFEITMMNTGTSDLTMVTLLDNLLGNLGCAYVNIATPPTFVAAMTNAMTNPTINPGFNGAGAINIFNGTSGLLKPCQKVTVRFTVRINPNCGAALGNTATGGATGNQYDAGPGALAAGPLAGGQNPGSAGAPAPSVGPVTISGGSVPAPGSPIGPGGILIINVPLISAVKRVVSTVIAPCPPTTGVNNAAGVVHVTFEIGIKNTGNVNLTNLKIEDEMIALLGAAFKGIVTPASISVPPALAGSVVPTLNAAYAGSGNILSGNATGILVPNDQVRVQITVAVDPNATAMQMNQATGRGTGPGPVITPIEVSDLSDSGTLYENNNIGEVGGATGQNDKTILQIPQLGVSKRIVSAVVAPCQPGLPGQMITTFEIIVKNTGNMPLTNLSLIENLAAQFGAAFEGIAPNGAPSLTSTAATPPTLNAAWVGTGDLFVPTTGNLLQNQTVTVRFATLTNPNAGAAVPQTNQATGSASGANSAGIVVIVNDLSDSGTDPESANVGQLGDSGCSNDVTVANLPNIGVSKRLVSYAPTPCPTGEPSQLTAVFEILVKNTGNVNLTNLTLVDNLPLQLGCQFQGFAPNGEPSILASTATTAPTMVNSTTAFFNGTTGVLAPNQSITVRFTALMNPNCGGPSPLTNQAIAGGTGLNFTNLPLVVTDLSDGGDNPEGANANAPGNSGCSNDPLFINLSNIALSKGVFNVVPAPCPAPIGHVLATFEMTMKNVGNVPVNNLKIADDMAAQMGCAFKSITTAPSIVTSTAATAPTFNANFNGGASNGIFNGTTGVLNPNQTITIRFTALMDPNCTGVADPLLNQATATVSGPNNDGVVSTFSDLSDSGFDPESNNVGKIGDSGCANDPTVVELPIILATKLEVPNPSGDVCSVSGINGHIDLAFKIRIKNVGNTLLKNPQISDNLQTQFGSAFVKVLAKQISNSTAQTTPILNAAYNGATNSNLFDGNSGWLRPEEYIDVIVTVELNLALPTVPNPLLNQASTAALAVNRYTPFGNVFFPAVAGNVIVSDLSDHGLESENTNTAFSGNTGCSNDPTNFNLPTISKLPADLTINAGEACAGGFDLNYEVSQYVMMHAGAVVTAAPGCGPIEWNSNAAMGIQWLPAQSYGCGCTGVWIATLNAKDQCGHTICMTFKITVVDNTGPCFDMEPMDKTVVCTDPNGLASVNMWLASGGGAWYYDCADDIIVTNNFSGTLPASGSSVTVTFTYTDPCGNKSTRTANLSVSGGNTPPVLVGIPANMTMSCDQTMPVPANVTATAACNAPVSVVYLQTEQAGGNACQKVFIRKWTATANGQTASGTQTITILDNVMPVLANIPANTTITCPVAPSFGTPTATDNCGAATISFTDASTGACPAAYSVTRTWIATDVCGNTSTASAKITVNPTIAPPTGILTMGNCPTNQNLTLLTGQTSLIATFATPTASSNCPTGSVSVTQTSGFASGSAFPLGANQVCFRATDGCGNTQTCCFTITVVFNTPPTSQLTINVPPNTTLNCGSSANFGIATANSTCPTGLVTMTQTDSNAGSACTGMTMTRIWTATDGCGNQKTAAQILTILPDNNAPTFNNLPTADMMFNCGQPIDMNFVTANDNCSTANVSFTQTNNGATDCNVVNGITYGYDLLITYQATDGCGNTAIAPPVNMWILGNGISFFGKPADKIMHCGELIEWNQPMVKSFTGSILSISHEDFTNLNACSAGTITRRWTAVDAVGNIALAEQTMTFMTDNLAPDMNFTNGTQIVACNSFDPSDLETPTLIDNCASNNQITLTHTDVQTTEHFTRTWTATDLCGNVKTAQQIVNFLDVLPPAFVNLPAEIKTIDCGQPIVFDAVAAEDQCNNSVILTYLDETNATNCASNFIRNWTATDEKGNLAKWTQTIIEEDKTAPLAATLPTDKSIDCNQILVFDNLTFYDNCHQATIVVNFTDETSTPTCGQSGFSKTRTWTANDGCDNVSNVSQTIAVAADQIAPVFIANSFPEIDLTQAELAVWTPNQSMATDNCSNLTIVPTTMNVIDQCHLDLTITAVDACGNFTTAIQPIHIVGGVCSASGTNDLTNQLIRIYPNPVAENLFVEAIGATIEGNERYQVQDIFGRILMTGNLENGKAEISVTKLNSGAYFLKLQNNHGEMSVKRFVKAN